MSSRNIRASLICSQRSRPKRLGKKISQQRRVDVEEKKLVCSGMISSVQLICLFRSGQIPQQHSLQFGERNWFGKNFVSPGFQRRLPVCFSYPSCANNHWHVLGHCAFAQTGSGFNAAHAGHAEIHKNKIRFFRQRLLHADFTIAGLDNLETQMANDRGKQLATIGVVLDN